LFFSLVRLLMNWTPSSLWCSWWSSPSVGLLLVLVPFLVDCSSPFSVTLLLGPFLVFLVFILVDQTSLNSWWSLVGALECGIVEFLLVVEPLCYYSYNFIQPFCPMYYYYCISFKFVPPPPFLLSYFNSLSTKICYSLLFLLVVCSLKL
jgi:hypothetical protein